METKKYFDLDYYKGQQTGIPLTLYPLKLEPHYKYKGDVMDYHINYGESKFGKLIYSKLHIEDDYYLLFNYAKQHGRYLEKFLFRDLSYRIRRQLLDNKNCFEEIIPAYSEFFHKDIDNIVYKHFVSDLIFSFVKVSIYHLLDFKIFDEILRFDEKYSEVRKCSICGNTFNLLKHPDWMYYGSNGNTTICFECPVPTALDKTVVNELIPVFVSKCGFIPESNFSLLNNTFTSKVPQHNWIEIARIVMQMGVSGYYNELIKQTYGSWFKALVEAKVLDQGILKTSRGVRCIAKSGNECNSLDEMFIDNWLFENGFDMIKEPRYPIHEKFNPKGLRRADWLVSGYYIEYFGLAGDEKYDQKTIEKIELLKELNLNYIALFKEDLKYLALKFEDIKK